MEKGFLKEGFSVHCQELYDAFEIINHVFAHRFCTGSRKTLGMSQKQKKRKLFFLALPLGFLSVRRNVYLGILLA